MVDAYLAWMKSEKKGGKVEMFGFHNRNLDFASYEREYGRPDIY